MAGRFSRRLRGWAQANGMGVSGAGLGGAEDQGRQDRKYPAEGTVAVCESLLSLYLGRGLGDTSRLAYVAILPSQRRSFSTVTNMSPAKPGRMLASRWNSSKKIIVLFIAATTRVCRKWRTPCVPVATGLLKQICERWIYTTCLCFALDSQEREVRVSIRILVVSKGVQPQPCSSAPASNWNRYSHP